jgi:hypothetical protein
MSLSAGSARRTVTFLAAEIDDLDGVLESVSTSLTAVTYVAADYDGDAISVGLWSKLPRTITITLSSTVGAFALEPIVMTGVRNGVAVTESLTPGSVDGGETLRGVQAFDYPPTIAFPAQADAGATISIGAGNICTPAFEERFAAVKLAANGQIHAQYGESSESPVDSFASVADELEPIAPTRLLTSAARTTPMGTVVTVYID